MYKITTLINLVCIFNQFIRLAKSVNQLNESIFCIRIVNAERKTHLIWCTARIGNLTLELAWLCSVQVLIHIIKWLTKAGVNSQWNSLHKHWQEWNFLLLLLVFLRCAHESICISELSVGILSKINRITNRNDKCLHWGFEFLVVENRVHQLVRMQGDNVISKPTIFGYCSFGSLGSPHFYRDGAGCPAFALCCDTHKSTMNASYEQYLQ